MTPAKFKTTVEGIPVTVTYTMTRGRILGVGTFHADDITATTETGDTVRLHDPTLRILENEALDTISGMYRSLSEGDMRDD